MRPLNHVKHVTGGQAVVTMSRYFHKMLPQCDGPKLHAFSKRAIDIQFIRLLSDNEQNGQSHIFEVIIDDMRYALKVVGAISCSCPG